MVSGLPATGAMPAQEVETATNVKSIATMAAKPSMIQSGAVIAVRLLMKSYRDLGSMQTQPLTLHLCKAR